MKHRFAPENVGARVHALCIGSIAERRWPDVGRDTMTVVCWTNPVRQRQDGMWTETGQTQPTKLHITRDGVQTVCGFPVKDDAVVVAVTPDWGTQQSSSSRVSR